MANKLPHQARYQIRTWEALIRCSWVHGSRPSHSPITINLHQIHTRLHRLLCCLLLLLYLPISIKALKFLCLLYLLLIHTLQANIFVHLLHWVWLDFFLMWQNEVSCASRVAAFRSLVFVRFDWILLWFLLLMASPIGFAFHFRWIVYDINLGICLFLRLSLVA